jgi:hypothetical protein
MNEYFHEAVRIDGPDSESDIDCHRREFRDYLVREFGITDSADQDVAMAQFAYVFVKTAREHGILPDSDPIEAARRELIALGITDFEQQKPILQNLYRDLEDPRPILP